MDKFNEEIAKFSEGSPEKEIGKYLLELAKEDLTLAKNLLKPNKNLAQCFEYIKGYFYKKSKNGFYFNIDNDVLFRQAIHYYQEDNISIDTLPESVKVGTTVSSNNEKNKSSSEVIKPKSKAKKDVPEGQMSLF